MKILGIDPGIGRLGWGVIEKEGRRIRPLQFGHVETPKNSDRGRRLIMIHRALRKVIRELKPDLVAVEELFFAKNVTTAMAVSEARGVVILTAAEFTVPVVAYSPMTVKSALGFGGAKKRQVSDMVKLVLGLRKEKFKYDDVADALAVAICAARQVKSTDY